MAGYIHAFARDIKTAQLDASEMAIVLGGKGASLSAMCDLGINVPPGFTITTQACRDYMECKTDHERNKLISTILSDSAVHIAALRKRFGYAPLLSVRSGAPVSMPGMMDTILNVGLTKVTAIEWIKRIGRRATFDSYRRLVQMLGHSAFGIEAGKFDAVMNSVKADLNAVSDADLNGDGMKRVTAEFKALFKGQMNKEFPESTEHQLRLAIEAVFKSWGNPRAIEYRKLNNIDPAMGTAVTVQAMVFGNTGPSSGTGVLFTRNPLTGEPGLMGEFLEDAQGEDVVAGIRTPKQINRMLNKEESDVWPTMYQELVDISDTLEDYFMDMVDVEFTVQKGELFVLQSRVGKRSAIAAFRIAADLFEEGLINRRQIFQRITKEQCLTVRRPVIDPAFKAKAHAKGLPACPGVVTGKPVFSAAEAIASKVPCILVTKETNPDDIAGMNAAIGILTATGGATCHAAVVARSMDKPCVVGLTSLSHNANKIVLTLDPGSAKHKAVQINHPDIKTITIDGSTGRVWVDTAVPVVDASGDPAVASVIAYAAREANVSISTSTVLDHETKQTIFAAAWWGNIQTMKEVFEKLVALPSRKNIILNLSSPPSFKGSGDDALLQCASTVTHTKFFASLIKGELAKNAHRLKGLTVAGDFEFDVKILKENGIGRIAAPMTVAELMEPDVAHIMKPVFVDHVIGGELALKKLIRALDMTGIKVRVALNSVPGEYALMKILS